jgi:Skp family chaperone for outer membrane proteins
MHTKMRTWNWPAIVMAAAALALAGYQSPAMRSPALATPVERTAVAVVDLEKLYAELNQKADRDTAVRERAETLKKDLADRKKALERLEQDLELFAPGTDKHDEALKKLAEAAATYQTQTKFGRLIIELENGRVLRDVYESIKNEARQLADELGYDLVVVDDSIAEVPPGGEGETTRQISARRVLYASPRIDITAALIERMNKAFVAGAGG